MTTPPEVSIIGTGGHAKVVVATLRAAGFRITAAYTDASALHGTDFLGIPVRGPSLDAASGPQRSVVAIGANDIRRDLAQELDLEWPTVVHPRAWVEPTARLGPGTVVFAGAVVQPDALIGRHAILNTGCTVDHDARVGDYAHVAPGAHLCGGVQLGEGALLGVGASAIPRIRIGAWTRVGAGAAVVSDLPERVTAVGVPARPR